jgi:hypothetical protein
VSCEQITFSTNECETLRLLLLRSRSGGTAVHIAFVLFLFPLSYPSPHPPWTTLSNLAAPSRSPLTGIDSPSIAILYHPDTTKKAQDCIDGTHVWIHNEKGFLTQVYLEEDGDKFKLVRGPRRPDIEAHNELNARERLRCRHEAGKFLPIPPDSDNDEDNVRPPPPSPQTNNLTRLPQTKNPQKIAPTSSSDTPHSSTPGHSPR